MIWYGDEIGMGENLALPEREAVRTPMQWSTAPAAGFSEARSGALVRPLPPRGPFTLERVNVRAQDRDPESLLNFIRGLVRARRSVPAIGWGTWQVLETDTRVLGLRTDWRGSSIVTFHNLSDATVQVDIGPELADEALETLFGDANACRPPETGRKLALPSYGFVWLRSPGGRPYGSSS